MRKTALLFSLILLFSTSLVFGRGVGTSGMNFLKVTHGPRFDGMAGAAVAAVNDINSISWNPAGLAKLTPDYFDVSMEHDFWIGGVEYEVLNFAQYLGDTYGAATQICYRHLPTIDNDLEDEIPEQVWDLVWTLGYGARVSNFAIGLNVKAIISQLGSERLIGQAADLGMQVNFMEDKLTVALAVQNLGADVSSDSLPLFIRGGVAFRDAYGSKNDHEILGALEVDQPLDNKMYLRLGFEYWYAQSFSARFGYAQQIGADDLQSDNFLDRLSLGTSVRWADLQLDYSYTPFADLGSTHKIALKLHYGPLTDTVENY